MSSDAIRQRIDHLMEQLVKRFENMIEYASTEQTDLANVALASNKLEIETAALIRAAQEVMFITRWMKTRHLLGGVQTVRDRNAQEGRNNNEVAAMVEALKRAVEQQQEHFNRILTDGASGTGPAPASNLGAVAEIEPIIKTEAES